MFFVAIILIFEIFIIKFVVLRNFVVKKRDFVYQHGSSQKNYKITFLGRFLINNKVQLKPDQIIMAVLFWYLINSDATVQ